MTSPPLRSRGRPGASHPGATHLRLSDLLGVPVVDEAGRRLGVVHDVTAVQGGRLTAGFDAALELTSLLVGGRGVRARLGLSPARAQGPWPVRLLGGVGRRTDSIAWRDVTAVDRDRIVVRARDDARRT